MILTQREIHLLEEFQIYQTNELKSNLSSFPCYLNKWTYFVKNNDNGLIKIGKSKNPFGRISSLSQTYNTKLEILGLVMVDIETNLHEKFRQHTSDFYISGGESQLDGRTEWFNADDELIQFIKSVFIDNRQDLILDCLTMVKFYPMDSNRNSDRNLTPPSFVIDPLVITAEQARKLKYRLSAPTLRGCRYSQSTFNRAVIKFDKYIERLVVTLCFCRFCYEKIIECDLTLRLSLVESIISGGFRYRTDNRTKKGFISPIQSNKNIEALVLLNQFFDRLKRIERKPFGNVVEWQPKEPLLNTDALESLKHVLNDIQHLFPEIIDTFERNESKIIDIIIPESDHKTKLIELLSIVFSHLGE